MRKLVVTMWVSLDGYICGPDGGMKWVTETFDEDMGQYEGSLVEKSDTLLLGRLTYESFAGSWPQVPDNPAVSEEEKTYARKMNAMRKVVFSRTLAAAEWNNSELARENIGAKVAALKGEAGQDMLIYGSASIVQQLTALDLIDEYQLLIHPVLLGGGKRLFKEAEIPKKLKLVGAKPFSSGVVFVRYRPR